MSRSRRSWGRRRKMEKRERAGSYARGRRRVATTTTPTPEGLRHLLRLGLGPVRRGRWRRRALLSRRSRRRRSSLGPPEALEGGRGVVLRQETSGSFFGGRKLNCLVVCASAAVVPASIDVACEAMPALRANPETGVACLAAPLVTKGGAVLATMCGLWCEKLWEGVP